jgi:hypothetical protein
VKATTPIAAAIRNGTRLLKTGLGLSLRGTRRVWVLSATFRVWRTTSTVAFG